MGIYIYTVGGIPTPLKNDGVRQWEYIYIYGWWYTYPSEK